MRMDYIRYIEALGLSDPLGQKSWSCIAGLLKGQKTEKELRVFLVSSSFFNSHADGCIPSRVLFL